MRTGPPHWAEALLRLFLKREVFASVSGDLLEQYRDSIHPVRGRLRADQWYVTQVFGFVLRGARLWAALFAAAYVARTALDWLRPTTDFHTRSEVSTALAAGILAGVGILDCLAIRLIRGGRSRRTGDDGHRRGLEHRRGRASAGDLA